MKIAQRRTRTAGSGSRTTKHRVCFVKTQPIDYTAVKREFVEGKFIKNMNKYQSDAVNLYNNRKTI